MNKNKVLTTIQSVLCVLSALALIAGDIIIYFKGIQAISDNPMADIYSVEAISEMFVYVFPVIIASITVTIICAVWKVGDTKSDRPAGDIVIRKNTDNKLSVPAVNTIRAVLFVVAVLFIVTGIFNGSLSDVFIKASKICTECIGLG